MFKLAVKNISQRDITLYPKTDIAESSPSDWAAPVSPSDHSVQSEAVSHDKKINPIPWPWFQTKLIKKNLYYPQCISVNVVIKAAQINHMKLRMVFKELLQHTSKHGKNW